MSPTAPIRIAIVSTPRSGNTWVRKLLAHFYSIPERAKNELTAEDWAKMPAEVVLQIHWHRTPEFVAKLQSEGFRVISLLRHPLDVLISVLHFSWYMPETSKWLAGDGGDEADILLAMPRSQAFLNYCRSDRARKLLSVTTQWWNQPTVLNLRYEDCVRQPNEELQRLEAEIGVRRCQNVGEVIQSCSLQSMRKTVANNHYWQGRPGLWRQLLTVSELEELGPLLQPYEEVYGYDLVPDPLLTASVADRNWIDLVRPAFLLTMADRDQQIARWKSAHDSATGQMELSNATNHFVVEEWKTAHENAIHQIAEARHLAAEWKAAHDNAVGQVIEARAEVESIKMLLSKQNEPQL